MTMGFVLRLALWLGGVGWAMVVMVSSVSTINDPPLPCCAHSLATSSMYKV